MNTGYNIDHLKWLRWQFYTFAFLGAFCIAACQAQDATSSKKPPANGQQVMLTLMGYNYTDHYIDNYYVDGQGGGNVFVSGPTSGGGGGTCCVVWKVGRKLPVKVHIRWQSGECTYTEHIGGGDFEHGKAFYSEQDVWLTQPVPANPENFETHFYPDGHIEVAITDDDTLPRLKLPVTPEGNRPGAKPLPRCTSEQLNSGGN